MTPLEQRKKSLTAAIFSLFFVWLICVVSLGVIPVIGYIFSKKWLPLVVLVILFGVMIYSRAMKNRATPSCYRITAVTTLILFFVAVIMLAINLIGVNWEPSWVKPQPYNENIPYVSALIIYPVTALASLWYLVIGRRSPACIHCRVKNGSYTERGLVSRLFEQESCLQLRVLCLFSAFISVVDWSYYFLRYVNVNYNSSDRFFFLWFPAGLTLLSIIYFYSRYMSMWRHYCVNPTLEAIHGNSTALRFIVIVGDHILLDHFNGMQVDTPVKCFIPFTNEVSMDKAVNTFRDLTGVKAPRMIRAYESEETTTLANTFHYLCFFDNVSEIEGARVPGQLYNYNRVVQMIKSRLLSPELRSELERIYTVAMAWKTYTLDGKRIYPVKHYRPSFRFRDIPDYNVDYNDRRWLAVTVNNEDKSFFKLRRFWNRHFNGF